MHLLLSQIKWYTKYTRIHTHILYIILILKTVFFQIVAASTESNIVYGQILQANKKASYSPISRSILLSIDRNTVDFKETDNDFRYISDALPKKPYFPASLCKFVSFI